VVFMLQVKRRERGFASLFSSFCSADTLRLEPSYLPFLSYSVGSLNEQNAEAEKREREKKSYRPVHNHP